MTDRSKLVLIGLGSNDLVFDLSYAITDSSPRGAHNRYKFGGNAVNQFALCLAAGKFARRIGSLCLTVCRPFKRNAILACLFNDQGRNSQKILRSVWS